MGKICDLICLLCYTRIAFHTTELKKKKNAAEYSVGKKPPVWIFDCFADGCPGKGQLK